MAKDNNTTFSKTIANHIKHGVALGVQGALKSEVANTIRKGFRAIGRKFDQLGKDKDKQQMEEPVSSEKPTNARKMRKTNKQETT